MKDDKVKNCFVCSDYFKCEKTETAKWFPCAMPMSCFKSLKIDRRV